MRPPAARGIRGPLARQVEAHVDRPGQRPLGIMAGDGDLAVAGFAQRARVLALHPGRRAALLGKAGIVEDQDAVPLGGQRQQVREARPVERLLVPGQRGQEMLQPLLGGAGDDGGQRVAVLVGVLGEESRAVAFQRPGTGALPKVQREAGQILV